MTGEKPVKGRGAKRDLLLCQDLPDFLKGAVLVGAERLQNGLLMLIRACGAAITPARLGGKSAACSLLCFPAADAGRAHAQTLASFAMRRASSDGIKNPLAKIDRQSSWHQGTLQIRRTLNQNKTDLMLWNDPAPAAS